MLMHLVTMGLGSSILPLSMVKTLQGNFKLIPIENTPWVTEPNLIWRSNGYLSAAAKEFLRFFQETTD